MRVGLRAAAFAAVLFVVASCGVGVEEQGAELGQSQEAATPGPIVTFTASPQSGAAPLAVYFDGTKSKPAGDGSWISACRIDFGDGTFTTACWGNKTYPAGSYSARFTATDNLGRASSATIVITSGSTTTTPPPDAGTAPTVGPTATLTASPKSGAAPLNVYLDGTTSKPAADGSWIASCRLDYGDGASTTSCWGQHSYAAGTWTARFTVTDNRGRSATATQVINSGTTTTPPPTTDAGTSTPPPTTDAGTSTPPPTFDAGTPDAGTSTTGPRAVLTASPSSGAAPLFVHLEGGTSKPAPDGSWITSCFLEFGDGTTSNACWGQKTYPAGRWTARFTVKDNLGRSSTASVTIQSGTSSDAGTPVADAGTPTTPPPATDAGTATPAPSGGWQIFTAAHGAPAQVYGVSSDAAGNLWIAGGDEGLFFMAAGTTTFRRFTIADGLTPFRDASGVARQQKVISVAGGPAGVAFIGYEGQPGCQDAFERYNFNTAYAYIWKSGDADRVALNSAGGISVQHYDISSGPGVVAAEPEGREKLCTILRVGYHAGTQSVWFGGNHGVSWGSATSNAQEEHTHPAINGFIARPGGGYTYTLLTDAYYGIAPLPNGDLWLGGANRSGVFRWSSLNRYFWNADTELQKTKVDLWPDAVATDSYPNQRTDDNVSDMALDGTGGVWASSISNGLVHWTPNGSQYLRITAVEPNSKATALERDATDGSLWVGFIWGGVARLKGGQVIAYGSQTFGALVNGSVVDIQADTFNGTRRLFVAFRGSGSTPSGVAIYTGQ